MDWVKVMSRPDYTLKEKQERWKAYCERVGLRYVASDIKS